MKGGDGKDIIDVKDGTKDRVRCGAGKDEVTADASTRSRATARGRYLSLEPPAGGRRRWYGLRVRGGLRVDGGK